MTGSRRTLGFELCATSYFVLSGACGLVYEVLWFKRFAHVWGSSSLAMASVVASFLAGLGLGAWLLGARADRIRRPLLAYAVLEFFIAAWAVCLPFVAPWCTRIAAAATPALEGQPLALTAVRVLSTFLLLAPACLSMGATLPLLVRWLALHGHGVGRATAWLYAFNAAGAAAGAWIAGFHLLPAIGMDNTNLVTAGVSAGIAVMAFATDRAMEGSAAAQAGATHAVAAAEHEPAGFEAPQSAPRPALYAAALLAGFGALALQMVWGRELGLLVGPTTFAFSALVIVFIAGLGAGSLCFALLGARLGDARRWIAVATLLIVAGTLLGRLASPHLAELVGILEPQRSSALFNAALCSGVSAVLEFVATFAMGMFFPALVALLGAGSRQAGASVGRIYAWNTVGSIVGALCTLSLLMPSIGSQATTTLALAAYLLALLCVLAPRWRGRELELGVVLTSIALLCSPWRSNDPRETNLGLYLYGLEAQKTLSKDRSRILSFREGANANVLVLELDSNEQTPGAPDRIKNLRVNGKVDASNWSDMPMQLGSAYFPMLLRPNTESVLVIGMGSGTTVGAALAFPRTRVTCCELEPEIVEAARFFAPENKKPHSSPRFRSVSDDGRNHVQAHAVSYDLIISEPSNPWIAGISNLYTQEFYKVVRERLNRGGLFVQWMQTYGLSAQQHALIAGTALSVFPQIALLRINEHDTLFLCANDPIVPSSARLDDAQALLDELTDVREDLKRYFGSVDVRALLLSVLMLDHAGVQALSAVDGHGEINTDANMRLEFGAPRDLFEMRLGQRRRPLEAIHAAFDPRHCAQLISSWGWTEAQAHALRAHKRALLARGDGPKAFAINELLLAYAADDLEAQADQLLWSPPGDPTEFQDAVRQLAATAPIEAVRVAKNWLDQGQFARARAIYSELAAAMPDSPTVLAGLALCHANLAEPKRARELLQRARKIDPLDLLVLDLERALDK